MVEIICPVEAKKLKYYILIFKVHGFCRNYNGVHSSLYDALTQAESLNKEHHVNSLWMDISEYVPVIILDINNFIKIKSQ